MTPEEALAHQTNFFSTQDILGNDRVAKANFVEGLLNSTEKANQDLGKQLNDIIGEYDNFIKRIRINYNRLGEVVGTDVQLLLDNNKILTESFRRTDIQGGDGNTFQRTTGQTYSETIQDTEIDQQNQYIALLKQEADLQNKINLENAKGNSQKANELVIQQNLIKAQMEQLETQRQQQGRGSFAIGSANVPQSITEARQNIANTSNILQERNNVTSLIEKIKEYQDIWKKLQNSKSKGNREETALLGSQLNNLTALIQQDKARFSLSTNSANIIRNLENENQEERNLIQTRERDNEAKKQNSQNTSELNSYLSQYVTLLREQSQIENKNDNVLYANSLDLVQQKMAQLNNNLTTGLQGLITYDEATKKFVFNETQAATSANLTSENIDKLRLATEQANNQMQQMNNSTKHQNEIEQINKTVAAYEKLKLAQYQLYNLQLSQPSSNKTKAQAIEVNNLTSEYNKQISIMNSLNANLVNSETYKNRMAQADERALNSANHYNTVVAKETTLLSRLGDQLKMVGRNVLNYNVFQMAFNKLRREIREAITIIKELDSAMLEIQLVTNGTDQEVRNLVVSYADLAKQLGVTLNSVTQGSVEWLRQGKTISEVNKLLTASTQLAKLGAMEASDASEKLTAILNSYKMEVEDVTSVVDKLVKVDLIAATSTEELATSLQYSASFAANAGVSFDKMIGLIATASETTRLSAETIGQAFKSIFSRMQNVKAGANVDDMGESLNNTEKVLRKYGIELRDTADEFRNIEEVIDEVGAKWEQFTSVQQAQIATAMAGVHQRNTFIATMSNYNKVLEYTTEATNAGGTAEEKYVNVLDSIEAKLNTLSTTWQIFINNMNMSEGFGNIVDSGTAIIEVLDVVMNKFRKGKRNL